MRAPALLLALTAFGHGCRGPECGPGTHLEEGLCVPDEADGDTDADTDTDTDTDPGPEPPVGCQPLPASEGREVAIPSGDVGALTAAVNTAVEGDVILLEDGTYQLDGAYLWIDVDGVTLRSRSGDREAVVLDGGYLTTEIVNLVGSGVTVADITIQHSTQCGMHVQPANGYDTRDALIYNVAVLDTGEHAVKVNQNGGFYTDEGTVACSRLEITDEGRPHIAQTHGGSCYTGGIDAHNTRGWHVYDNHIAGYWCPTGLSEHGIHFWNCNADTVIERNVVVNSARGIGLGMHTAGEDERGFGAQYDCAEGAAPDDFNATVRNNVVFADDPELFASGAGFDAGIEIENGCLERLLHNTVWSTEAPYSSMSWRYAGTSAHIANNLLSHNLRERDAAEVLAEGNLEGASAEQFLDAAAGDLHLAAGAAAVDAGVPLAGDSAVTHDLDGDARDASPDVGADER